MRKTMLLMLLVLLPLAADAQDADLCSGTHTVGECFQSVFDASLPKAAGQSAQSKVQAMPTGPTAPNTPIGSATSDFLSRFLSSLESAQLDQKNRQLNVAYNLPAGVIGSTLQLQAVFYQPEVFKKVQDMLTSSGKTQALSDLQNRLNDADDVSATLTLAPQTTGLGRSFKAHRDRFERLYTDVRNTSAVGQTGEERADELQDEVNRSIQRYISLSFPPETTIDDLKALRISDVEVTDPRFVEKLKAEARSEAELESVQDKMFNAYHLASFADLLANQPQLSFSASGRWRDRTVGPNEVMAEASYEVGFVNLNGACPNDPCDKEGFKKYVENHMAGLKAETSDKQGSAQNRLKLTVDYSRTQAYALSLPADNIDLQMPRATHLTYAATYGRQVVFDKQGNPFGRIDVTGKYENFSDDPLHQDRGTLDLTYTQRVSDSFSLPLGISYANHGEFLGQVDRRLSAHFGLHAKIFGNGQ